MAHINTPTGTITVSNFADDTSGDEYSTVTLDAGGAQYDLSRDEACQLIDALRSNVLAVG